VVDKLGTKEHIELARGLFESVEEALEMTHFGSVISEAEGLANAHVRLLDSAQMNAVSMSS
jgi:hypothetical protein